MMTAPSGRRYPHGEEARGRSTQLASEGCGVAVDTARRGDTRMAIGPIADDTIDPGHKQESAPRFPQLGVLEEARRRPGFPGSELSWAPDRSSRFVLTTLWESTGACSAWQTQQFLPGPQTHPDFVGLGQPGTATSWRSSRAQPAPTRHPATARSPARPPGCVGRRRGERRSKRICAVPDAPSSPPRPPRTRLQDTVVCTHGEVIGQVLTRLVTDGLAVDQPLQWAKGSTWLLDGANGRLTHARYLPPLVLAPARSMASAPRGPVLGPDASSRPGV